MNQSINLEVFNIIIQIYITLKNIIFRDLIIELNYIFGVSRA